MFLNKWTVRVSRPNQIDEEPFDTQAEAEERAQYLQSVAEKEDISTLYIINPDETQQCFDLSAPATMKQSA